MRTPAYGGPDEAERLRAAHTPDGRLILRACDECDSGNPPDEDGWHAVFVDEEGFDGKGRVKCPRS